jgi:hypothetical protein
VTLALVVAAAAVAAGVRALRGRSGAPELPALRFEVSTAPTDDPSLALSPDGTELAFVANRDRVPVLWVPRSTALQWWHLYAVLPCDRDDSLELR